MKLSRQKKQTNVQLLNMPAMIDVVMLLLIFFMVTSSFNRPEQHIDAEVARSCEAAGLNFEDFEPVEVEIRQGTLRDRLVCDGQECKDYNQLKACLTARRVIADLQVVVRADDEVRFKSVVEVVDLCYATDFTRVGFGIED